MHSNTIGPQSPIMRLRSELVRVSKLRPKTTAEIESAYARVYKLADIAGAILPVKLNTALKAWKCTSYLHIGRKTLDRFLRHPPKDEKQRADMVQGMREMIQKSEQPLACLDKSNKASDEDIESIFAGAFGGITNKSAFLKAEP